MSVKKRGLGQGLSALLGPNNTSLTSTPEGDIQNVFTSQLKAGQFQPRENFNEEEIESLARSIESNGILQPLLVRKKGEKEYEIIAGERRWRAAKKVGLDKVPVLIRNLSDEEALTVALVENLQRENLNPLEEALGYQRIMEHSKVTQEEVATLVGKGRTHITNMLRLLQLPGLVQNLIKEGTLTLGHGKVLLGSGNVEEIALLVVQKGLNIRQTERLIRKKRKGFQGEAEEFSEIPEDQEREESLSVSSKILSPEEKEKLEKQKAREAVGIQRRKDADLYTEEGGFEEILLALKVKMGTRPHIKMTSDEEVLVTFSLKNMDEFDDFLSRIYSIDEYTFKM